MPSRNVYSYLAIDGSSRRDMDINSERDRDDIFLAASLCRIVVRALELDAFKYLQKGIDDVLQNKLSQDSTILLVRHLAQHTCNLRWRISWWTDLGIQPIIHDESTNSTSAYIDRVTKITKSLYLWYFVVKDMLPSSTRPSSLGDYKLYADAFQTVFDDYPQDESDNGFYTWMSRGHSLIHRAYMRPSQQEYP